MRPLRLPGLLLALACCLPAAASAVEPGDVVFTELMIDSFGTPEWIELYATAASDVDLAGCELREDNNSFVIPALVVPSRDYVVASDGPEDCVIFDVLGACQRPSDLVYGSLTLNNGGAETLELLCDGQLIDSVTYEWSDFEADCEATGAPTCSVNVAFDRQSAEANDDWEGSWCVAPSTDFVYDTLTREMVSTPWLPGACPEQGPLCGTGDAVFTELMIDPPTSTREWFELRVTTGSGCDLHACTIWEGPFEELTDLTHEDWDSYTIDAPGNSLPIGSGDYALFSKGADTVVGQEGDPGAILSDGRYSGISFGNSEPGWIHLVCDGALVDSAPYDWTAFEGGCPVGSCSVNLPGELEDGTLNDDLGAWCLAPDDIEWTSSDDAANPFFGTPDGPGACLTQEWPAPGEVVFSELMIAPVSSSGEGSVSLPEWFELASVTDQAYELVGCTLQRLRYGEDGALDPATLQEHIIGTLGSAPVVPAGGALAFVKGECIDGTEASSIGTCSDGDATHFVYESLSFSNGNVTEQIELLCPDGSGGDPVLVDSAVYNQTQMGDRSGHSMQFDPSVSSPGEANDSLVAWCEASFDDCIPGAVTDEGQCNYGTPGVAGPCTTGQVEVPDSGPGCRCDARASSRPAGALLALLALLGSHLLRRRKP